MRGKEMSAVYQNKIII